VIFVANSAEEIFNEIIERAQEIAVKSATVAAKKAHKDIIKESERQLDRYYANYKPKKYRRTKRLQKAITPIFIKSNKNDIASFEIGVEYDSNKLRGFYHSNSWYHQTGTHWIGHNNPCFDFDSQNNGIPQPEWIMNNFLEGRHIWGDSNGDQSVGKHSWGQIDAESPRNLMEDFLDNTIEKYVYRYMSEEMTKNLIRELKNYGR
jgi:phospholipase C